MSLPIYVLGTGLWPETAAHASAKPPAQLLTSRMRGRASLLTAIVAEVVQRATCAAGLAAREWPSIFGSAYGEMTTLEALIQQLYAGDGALSPAKFQASVHNTAAGQLSIATGNERFSTSIAAGRDTVAMVLVEAVAWLDAHPGAVLIACADEAASAALQPGVQYGPLAAACVLSNRPGPGAALAQLEALQCRDDTEQSASSLPLAGNPCEPAAALIRAVTSGRAHTLDLNPGSPCTYSVSVQPALRESR